MEIDGYKLLPTRFGQWTEYVSDEYPIYKFHIPSTIIDHYLPDKLQAFPSVTWKNLAKRYFFYTTPVIVATRSQINDHIEHLSSSITLRDLFKEFLTQDDSYNFVIMDNCLIFIRLSPHRHIPYYMLGKHIILSYGARDVRFAGEIWCDENNCLQLNNSSGTYRPSDILIEQAVKFFNYLVPELQFQGTTFRISAHLSIKHRVTRKIKQKLTINHDQYVI